MDEQALQDRLIEVEVPEHIVEGLAAYVVQGRPTGDFLRAVLEDKFLEAFMRADDVNIDAMFKIAGAIYNEVPMGCHGSPERFTEWIEKRGLRGIEISWWLEIEKKWQENELAEVVET